MAYQKPGVTVRQVQATASFPLPSPTVEAAVVGPGYYWQDIESEDSVFSGIYDGTELTVDLTAFTSYTTILEDSIHVELIKTKGTAAGDKKILEKTTNFSLSGTDLTLVADIPGYTDANQEAQVKIGFLAANTDISGAFAEISNTKEIGNFIAGSGRSATWFNPLAYGAEIAIANSGSSVNVVGVTPASGAEDFSNAMTILETKPDVYAIAGLTRTSGEDAKLSSHVTNMSLPVNKAERIAFASRDSDSDYSSGKAAAATAIAAYAQGINNKRFFNIVPDVVYVQESTHISSLNTLFIQAVYGSGFDYLPRLSSSTEINGTTYPKGTEITSTIREAWRDQLEGSSTSNVTVEIPVPGYFLGAAAAGRVSSKAPAAPLTNASLGGPFSGTKFSNDYFNQDQLNTIAGGGNWVVEEKGFGTLVTRHQLSTAASTIQTRELSITTQIDYAAKFLRDLVSPTIGINVISDGFLRQLRAALEGASEELVQTGVLRELTVLDVYQDDVNPDTVKADFSLLPLYPVNYIRITLTF